MKMQRTMQAYQIFHAFEVKGTAQARNKCLEMDVKMMT
jgi:hypothetical protein